MSVDQSTPLLTADVMLRPDDGAQEPEATVDDDPYYTGGAYYYVLPADDDRE